MYSWEIQNWLSDRNYSLTSKEYIWLIKDSQSKQIDHIKFDTYSDRFQLWTKDGYEWMVNVTYEE